MPPSFAARAKVMTEVTASACSGPNEPSRRSILSSTAWITRACITELAPQRSQKQPPACVARLRFAACPDQLWLPFHHLSISPSAS